MNDRSRTHIPWFRLIGALISIVVGLAILLPIVNVLLDVLGFGGEEGLGPGILQMLATPEPWRVLANTAIVILAAAIIALAGGALLAWLNERTDARIGWLAEIVPLLPMFVPPLAGAIGWVFLLAPDAGFINSALNTTAEVLDLPFRNVLDIYSWGGMTVLYGLYLTPYAYMVLSTAFRNLDPSIEEAARVGGAGKLEMLVRVTIPSLRPAFGGAFLMVIAMGFALFSVPIVIATPARINILSVEVVYAMTRAFPSDEVTALGYGAILATVVAFVWWFQTRLTGKSGYSTIGGRHSVERRTPLGRWRRPAQIALWAYLLATSVIPIIAIVIVSLQPFWTPDLLRSAFTLSNYESILSRSTTVDAIWNTILLAAVAATIGTVVSAVIVHYSAVRGGTARRILDAVTKVPMAVPNIVFALTILLTYAGAPFFLSGTLLILGIAYVLVYLPQASIAAGSSYLQVGKELREAAIVSGAGEGSVFARILLPLMKGGLVAGWALVFVLVMGDVNVAALMASTRTPLAGFVVLDLWQAGTFPLLAALATLMTLASALIVGLAMLYGRRSAAKTATGKSRTRASRRRLAEAKTD